MYRTAHRCARTLARGACALLAACASGLAQSAWQYDVDAGLTYDSNVNRAYAPADIRADAAFALDASAGWFYAVSGGDGLTFADEATTQIHHRFAGLNALEVAAAATYRHKFGLGYAAPWIALRLSAAGLQYRDDLRDGGRVEAQIEMGQRFTPEFDAALGGVLERRYARHDEPVVPGISGKVFDLRGQALYARAGYALTERLLVAATLAVRRGDVVASTRRDFAIFTASDAVADPAFGADFFAYRLRGTTDTAKLSASCALDGRSSLNAVYADERTDAAGSIDYRSHSASLLYAWRY